MIFLDANIPMYMVGADHPNKFAAERLVATAVGRGERLCTNVEVLQEILHRYTSVRRLEAIQPAFDALLALAADVFPVDIDDLQAARQFLLGGLDVSARDALHVAVMRRHDVRTVMSFDRGFDRCAGITRLG